MSWWLTKVKERNENIINAQNTVANIKGSKIVSNTAFNRCKDFDNKIKRYDVLISRKPIKS